MAAEDEEWSNKFLVSVRRWETASIVDLRLINPPESARLYDDGPNKSADVSSVLGSRGEWVPTTADSENAKKKWVSLDLGSRQEAHALVIQSGHLVSRFSGKITKIRVHYTEDAVVSDSTVWRGDDRDIATKCGSDPLFEHEVPLKAPVFLRHIRLTPTAWSVSSNWSSEAREISTRVAVLVATKTANNDTAQPIDHQLLPHDDFNTTARSLATVDSELDIDVRYRAQLGARVSLSSGDRLATCSGTVVSVKDGRLVVSVDNTRTLGAFEAWAAQHFGRAAMRGCLHPVLVDPSPRGLVHEEHIRYDTGTKLLVVFKEGLVDATVVEWLGPTFGNAHSLKMAPDGRALRMDLNRSNHSRLRFENAGEFADARRRYNEKVAQAGAIVEDAITGNQLEIKDQLINLNMVSGRNAVRLTREELATTDPADLDWELGAPDLAVGDRVRNAQGSAGWVGWRNADGAVCAYGTKKRYTDRVFCGVGACSEEEGEECAACNLFKSSNSHLFSETLTKPGSTINSYGERPFRAAGFPVEFDNKTFGLLLSHDLQQARPISGVHLSEWTGTALKTGDRIAVCDRAIKKQATSKKQEASSEIPLLHGFRPLKVGPISRHLEIVGESGCKRIAGCMGGIAMSAEPIPTRDGEALFEIQISKMDPAGGDEGLEIGVTTAPPETWSGGFGSKDYAASVATKNGGTWMSADAGDFWTGGSSKPSVTEVWRTTRASQLKAGDVIRCKVILADGRMQIWCNGVQQTDWPAQVDTSKPLYALYGHRHPLIATRARVVDHHEPKKSQGAIRPKEPVVVKKTQVLRLKNLSGEVGEVVDLTRCGQPKYPGVFANPRSVSTVKDLFPLLLKPGRDPGRLHGKRAAQAVLIRAAPGTGKSWCIMQLLYFLASANTGRLDDDGEEEKGKWAKWFSTAGYRGGCTLRLAPFALYVQKLARLMREDQVPRRKNLFEFYLLAEQAEGLHSESTVQMLLQLFEMRMLILLVDGVDEAADLKEIVEDYLTEDLVPAGHPVIVTSRPEGLRLRLYARHFVVMNLEPLTKDQQRLAINMQLQGSEFFDRLNKFSAIRARHDEIFTKEAFPRDGDRDALQKWKVPNKFKLVESNKKGGWDPEMRNRNLENLIIRKHLGPPTSDLLSRLSSSTFSPDSLEKMDRALFQKKLNAGSTQEVDPALIAKLDAASPPNNKRASRVLVSRLADDMAIPVDDENFGLLATRLAALVTKLRKTGDPEVTASRVWPEIVQRTDELYALTERAKPYFDRVMRDLFISIGEDPDATVGGVLDTAQKPVKVLTLAPLKDPVRAFEKAQEDYAHRFDDDVPAEACVTDIVRARGVATSVRTFREMAESLTRGFRVQLEGFGTMTLELVRGKNKFKVLDPTHFRHILCNLVLHVEEPNGRKLTLFCEVQLHHVLILSHNEETHAHAHYEFFRSNLKDYGSSLKSSLDFMLETRIRVFEEVGRVPVLLSMLIVVLGAQQTKEGIVSLKLPANIYELYTMAVDGVLKRQFDDVTVAQRMLRDLAVANQLARRRTFSLEQARSTLQGELLELWEKCVQTGVIPLIKVLALGKETGEFQFKHLSIQEALFVEGLKNNQALAFWEDDAAATSHLNNAAYENVFKIGQGILGNILALQRPCWDFTEQELTDRGWAKLQELLPTATELLSLKLDLNTKCKGKSPLVVTTRSLASTKAAGGNASSFFRTELPDALGRAFRAGRVHLPESNLPELTDVKEVLRVKRVFPSGQKLSVGGSPEEARDIEWVRLEDDLSLPYEWFKSEAGARIIEVGCYSPETDSVTIPNGACIVLDQGVEETQLLQKHLMGGGGSSRPRRRSCGRL